MTTPQLPVGLRADEGLRLRAYRDSRGRWTIGYGHTPARPGQTCTPAAARAWLDADIAIACRHLDAELPWWRTLNGPRQDAVANMAFNLGVGRPPSADAPAGSGLEEFQHFLAALEAGEWIQAVAQMRASEWASQVGARAVRLEALILDGAYPS